MTTPKISVIIPVYNVEKYLEKCLESLKLQTLPDIEIIVVNDCTPDNSQAIIDTYCKNDSRFSFIIHKKNKGHGGALNSGIEQARGEYIWLIDSDDYVDINACEFLYSYAKEYDTDVLAFGANDFVETENGRLFIENHKYAYPAEMTEQSFTGEAFIIECLLKYSFIHTPPWGYLFNKTQLENFTFRENVSFEDTDAAGILLQKAKKIKCLKYSPYYRLIHDSNSVDFLRNKNAVISEKVMLQRLQVVKHMLQYIEEYKLKRNSGIAYMCYRFYSHAVCQELARYKKQGNSEFSVVELEEKVQTKIYDVLGTKNFGEYKRKYGYDELLHQAQLFPGMSFGKKVRYIMKWLLTKFRLNKF